MFRFRCKNPVLYSSLRRLRAETKDIDDTLAACMQKAGTKPFCVNLFPTFVSNLSMHAIQMIVSVCRADDSGCTNKIISASPAQYVLSALRACRTTNSHVNRGKTNLIIPFSCSGLILRSEFHQRIINCIVPPCPGRVRLNCATNSAD